MSYGEGGTKLAILVEKIQKMKKEKKVQINVAHWQKEKPINLELRKKKKKKKRRTWACHYLKHVVGSMVIIIDL